MGDKEKIIMWIRGNVGEENCHKSWGECSRKKNMWAGGEKLAIPG